jgi:hypothetical protein
VTVFYLSSGNPKSGGPIRRALANYWTIVLVHISASSVYFIPSLVSLLSSPVSLSPYPSSVFSLPVCGSLHSLNPFFLICSGTLTGQTCILYAAFTARAGLVNQKRFRFGLYVFTAPLLMSLHPMSPFGVFGHFSSALPVRTWSHGLLGANTGIPLPLPSHSVLCQC